MISLLVTEFARHDGPLFAEDIRCSGSAVVPEVAVTAALAGEDCRSHENAAVEAPNCAKPIP